MRGETDHEPMMFVVCTESMVPADHPLRAIKKMADRELERMSPVFDSMYSKEGRPSIPPEQLLKASLLMALYSVRSERQICQQLKYNFLFRWFLDMNVNEEVFNDSVFAKNRERLLKADVARAFFEGIVGQAREAGLLASDQFTVDGTLIDAWASIKSFKKKDPPDGNSKPGAGAPKEDAPQAGAKLSNETHRSTTDPEARLKKMGRGKEAYLSYMGHAFMENRSGLCVDIAVTRAEGACECEQALRFVKNEKARGGRVASLGADKGYDNQWFIPALKSQQVRPHIAAKKYTAMDWQTLRSKSYAASLRCRRKVEKIFGWMKTIGGLRTTRYKGVARTGLYAYLVGAAYNLVRMSKLITT